MAKVNIRLVWNPESRKRDIIVDYQSDADAMSFEHEDDHKNFINKLIEGGLVKAQEAGVLILERDTESQVEWQSDDNSALNIGESNKNNN